MRLWRVNKLTVYSESSVKINFQSEIEEIGKDKRKFYIEKKEREAEKSFENDLDENLYEEIEAHFDNNFVDTKTDKKLLQFTKIPFNRWNNLAEIESIEERNKPSMEQEIQTPFFLDFDNPLNKIKQELEAETMKKKTEIKSKIIRNEETKEFLSSLSQNFEKILENIDISQKFSSINKKRLRLAFSFLEKNTASKINYLIKRALFEDEKNVIKMLMMFVVIYSSNKEVDIKNLIFKVFIEVIRKLK